MGHLSFTFIIDRSLIESDKLKVIIVPIGEGTCLHRNREKTRILYD
jgi:hypothetical protein